MTPPNVKAAVAAVIILTIGGGIALLNRPHNQGGTKDINATLIAAVQNQATPVTVTSVGYGTIVRELHLTGTIQSRATADVSALAAGQVQAVYVTEGSHVRPGQVLAVLDATQALAQVSQSEQQVASARSALEKATAARTLSYQQADNDVAQARMAVIQAETGRAKADAGAGQAAIDQAAANARQAHASASEADATLKRTRFLFDHGVTPRAELDDARTKAMQAQDQADAADAAVRMAKQGASSQDRQLAVEKVEQARQSLAQTEAARQSRRTAADADVGAAETQVASAQDQLRLNRVQLGLTHVVSPISGVVTTVRIHAGEAAAPGAPVFSITTLGSVYFQTLVSESEKLQLSAGEPARITLQALPGHVFEGRVSDIVPVINPGAAGYELHISIPQPAPILSPGGYARASVETGSASNVLVVPAAAVLTQPTGEKYVYVVRNGTLAVQKSIVTGLTNGSQVELISGLDPKDAVVTVGAELLNPGAHVTIEPGAR